MFRRSTNKISLAASTLLLCAGFAQAQTTPVSPLTPTPTAVSIAFTLPSTAGAASSISLAVHTGSDPFVIEPTSVPSWLNTQDVTTSLVTGGTATSTTPFVLYFQASSAAAALEPGSYTAPVHLAVNGFQDLVVPVTLTVSGAASTLSITSGGSAVANAGSAVVVPWTYGQPAPSLSLDLLSSNTPIAFTAVSTVNGTSTEDWLQLSASSGIAYNIGTTLTVNFAQDALTNATVGSTLTGYVTISYLSTTYVVNISLTVGEPLPTVTSIFPQETPVLTGGTATVVVTGTGFGTTAQGFTTPTVVSIAYGSVTATDLTTITGGQVRVVNPTTMVLTIPYQDATPASILASAQTVTIGVTNGLTGETSPVNVSLYVTTKPIIYSITDAAALVEPATGSAPNVAPYEMVTIFGSNFCPTCSAPVVAATTSSRYPTTLTAPVSGGHALTVAFYKSDGTTLVGDAYLLFADNTQINAMVPSTVLAADNPMKIVVSYNSVLSNTNVAYSANAVTANPGVFTLSSSGQGAGAILLANYSVVTSSNKALPGSTLLIYLSGMGAPNSTATDTSSTTAAKFPTSCISPAAYVTAAALTSPATADGAVLVSTDIQTGKLPPCFATANQVAVTIGGATATVTYAGWVSGSVTGLYQVNATVPTKAIAGNLPVLVTIGGVTSQAGVTVAVN